MSGSQRATSQHTAKSMGGEFYMRHKESGDTFIYSLIIVVAIIAIPASYFLYNEYKTHTSSIGRQSEFASKFGLSNENIELIGSTKISRLANLASNEPCDWRVISDLAEELLKSSLRRSSAELYEYYDRECASASVATWKAANVYEQIGDFEAALRAIQRFIDVTAENPNGYYLRGRANEQTGNADQAVSDYLTTISLINDPSKTSYGVFRSLSRTYEAQGMYCEAASFLQAWTYANGQQENNQVGHLIDSIRSKGECRDDYASGSDTFRHTPDASGVVYAEVLINGQKGRFIVDTGAALVSLSSSFAKRLNLSPPKNSEIVLNTANGITYGNRIMLDSVKIGNVDANDVQGVMMQKDDAFSDGLDGLLGRSFLSRFDVKFERGRWSIETRN